MSLRTALERLSLQQELFPITLQFVALWIWESSLVLSKGPDFHYRRKRYGTTADWYIIRGMAPINDNIDPLRISAPGVDLGELKVLEEGLV